ncbi:MAG: hypothetical protein OEM81_00250 [Acidimicrobiia bacterium]|nr:hypothetical protein [Acidimicrobiia bacterium]MDH3396241.1 hypothetical protein [Acidimicrobiia bacterium]
MQGLLHQYVMEEMTRARRAELAENARAHSLRARAVSYAGWRDRVGLRLIHAGVHLVSRPLEVRVRPSQSIAYR